MEHTIANPFQRLWQLIKLEKKEISSVYFYAILSGLVQLSVPIGVQSIIGFVLGASMVTSIYVLIFLVVLGVFLVGVFQINQMKIIEKIQQSIFTRHAFEFAEKIPRFDLRKTDNSYLPEVANRFFDTINVQKGISKLLLEIPTATIQVLFGLLLLALYHPLFIAFGAILIFILWLVLKVTSKAGLQSSLKESSYKYAVAGWLEEMARVIKSFKFSQGSHLNLTKTDKNVSGYLDARTSHFKILLFQYRTLVAFKVLITSLMLIAGTYLLLNQQLNIGEFIAAEIVILTVIAAVEKLIGSLDSAYDVITGLEKLATVTEKPLEKDGALNLAPNGDGVSISLNDFSFSYNNGAVALRNVSANIPANKIVSIVGSEGSGKSSLLKILTGSYSEFTGSISINNIPLNSYSRESIRSNTGVLLNQQDVFEGTVWENITMGKKEITTQKIAQVAKELGIDGFLNSHTDGYDTELDPIGNRLPENTIKKILLLRAFSNDPSLLLLEHPWEGHSSAIAQQIVNYIFQLKPKATIIVVNNDKNFIAKSDIVLEVEDGKVTVLKQ